MIIKFLIFLLALSLTMLTGCFPFQAQYPSEVPSQVEQFTTQIIPGKMTHIEVQERLGEAFIRNPTVEVYRVDKGYDIAVEFLYIASPYPPIPYAWDTEEVIVYAMVIYDDNDLVQSIDWGIFRSAPEVTDITSAGNISPTDVAIGRVGPVVVLCHIVPKNTVFYDQFGGTDG